MLFNSMAYAFFLPVVFILYHCLPHRYRWILLLVASYWFYMSWNPAYVVLILFTTCVSYFCGILLEKQAAVHARRLVLLFSLFLCLGVLFVFKYYNFTVDSLSHIIPFTPRYLNVLLPVGISFYTFQSLSYVIDVYRGRIHAERHFGIYATFVSFFPQLVAGPIERSDHLLPQIRAEHGFDPQGTRYGIRLILWGLIKKVLIADNLAAYVDRVYGDIYSCSGFCVLLATLFFTIQIYCDFSGYSDIARGSARMFGIDLMENFKSPYFADSVRDFWKRWHISLSSWFKDYLYIPLGGNRCGVIRRNLNILVTFLISGLWHGANWTFVVWGGLHGLAQICENLTGAGKTQSRGIRLLLRRIVVFCFAAFAWIFFRANDLSQGFYAVRVLFTGITAPAAYLRDGLQVLGIGLSAAIETSFYILLLSAYDLISLKTDIIAWIGERTPLIRHAALIAAIGILLLFGYTGQSAFVYFQF